MTRQLTYSLSDTDSNNDIDPYETWEDSDDLPDHDGEEEYED